MPLNINEPEVKEVTTKQDAEVTEIHIVEFHANAPVDGMPTLWVRWEEGTRIDGKWACAESHDTMVDGARLVEAMLSEQPPGRTLRVLIRNNIYGLLEDEFPEGTVS